jgi:hypothetical protein
VIKPQGGDSSDGGFDGGKRAATAISQWNLDSYLASNGIWMAILQ